MTGVQFIDTSRFPGGAINDANDPSFQDAQIGILNLRSTYEINPAIQLQFEASFLDSDYIQPIDSDFSAFNFGNITRIRDFSSQQYELKLLFDGDRATGVFGVLYANIEEDSATNGSFPFGPGFATLNSSATFDATNAAVFGEVEYDLGRGFAVIGGLRYDYEEQDSFQVRTITGVAPEDPVILSTSFDALLPKIGIVYDFTVDRSLGFTIQRGYRSGGALAVPALNAVVPFDPEFTTNYELAYRSQSEDGSWVFNANAFYTRWEDQQVSVGTSILDSRIVNAGESEYYGFEIDAKWQPTANWDLYASAAYVQTEFLEFDALDLTGNEFRDAPDITASIGGTYFFNNGAYVSGDVSYTAPSFSNAANTIRNDERLITNLRAGYRQNTWEMFVYVRNLFDEEYTLGGLTAPTGTFATAGEPRTFGVVLKSAF